MAVEPVEHALDMGLTAPVANGGAAARVPVDHADLVGAAGGDQPESAQDGHRHIAFDLTASCQRGHVPPGVGHQQDLVVTLGDEPLDQHRARPGGGFPVDVAHVVAGHIGPQVVELHAAVCSSA